MSEQDDVLPLCREAGIYAPMRDEQNMRNALDVYADDWPEFELLDSGNRRKLERFGPHVLDRPEPKAWWRPDHDRQTWAAADAICDDAGKWTYSRHMPKEWSVRFRGLALELRVRETSKHLGLFPEQSVHWSWIMEQGLRAPSAMPRLLNLFGYTGVASLAAVSAGFTVTHVDASKPAISWAKSNQERSGLVEKPVRWILDDVMAFVRREIRRGRHYEAILLDPPSWGRGPNREIWKAEEMIPHLLELCRQLLSDEPLFLILTMYNLDVSSLMLGNLLSDALKGCGGEISVGELVLKQSGSGKVLPRSIFGKWKNGSVG
jgi:23S rRNA (cytosine1962-C5)-methyltransferase